MLSFAGRAILASQINPVFRLKVGGKTPAFKGWQEEATRDPELIRRLWNGTDYNIGIVTGNGLVVLDVDVKDGKPGRESWAELGITGDTRKVSTPTTGWHEYYKSDIAVAGRLSFKPGLDLKAEGGYVVAPGSVVDGKTYDLVSDAPIAPMPEVLPREPYIPPAANASIPVVDLDKPEAVETVTVYLTAEAPLAVQGLGGDNTTYLVACRAKDLGVSEDVALDLMLEHWNDRCSPPWDDEALADKIRHAYRYGKTPPGSGTIEAQFAGVEVEPLPRKKVRGFVQSDLAEDEFIPYLVDGVVPTMGSALLAGPPGAAKTFIGTELARCVGTGKPFFGHEIKYRGGTAFLFAGSEGGNFFLRVRALGEPKGSLPIFHCQIGDMGKLATRNEIKAQLVELNERMEVLFGLPLRLLILETLNTSGLAPKENDSGMMGEAMRILGSLAIELRLLLLTTHHVTKAGDDIRGSGAIIGAADVILQIYREGKDPVRHIEIVKARNGPEGPLGSFTLLPVDLGPDPVSGQQRTTMTVSMGEAMERSDPKATRLPKHYDRFTQALDFAEGEQGVMLDGEKWIPVEAAKGAFKDLTPDMSPSLRSAAFRTCLDKSIEYGFLARRVDKHIEYVIRKEFNA